MNVAIIGTRRCTPYGAELAQMAAEIVADCGHTLITSAAIGCAASAARKALDMGAPVHIVSACKTPYPSANADMWEQAEEVTYATEDEDPKRYQFLIRDMTIAELADVVIVCECGHGLSSVETLAKNAHNLGKQVYAFPGSVLSPTSAGCNKLIADGTAEIVTGYSNLHGLLSLKSEGAGAGCQMMGNPIIDAIIANPSRPDELAQALSMSTTDVLKDLAYLETVGRVERYMDGRYFAKSA